MALARLFSTSALALTFAFLAGCGGVKRRNCRTDFKVALLTPGPISDQSWNGGAYEGLMRIRDSLGAQVSHIQTKTPAEFEENFRQYGAQGYSLGLWPRVRVPGRRDSRRSGISARRSS